MKEGVDYEVIWSGRDPLLPPRNSRPQIPVPICKETRLYKKKRRENGTGNMGDHETDKGESK